MGLWDTKYCQKDHPIYLYKRGKALDKILCLFLCFISYILEFFRVYAAGRWLTQCNEGPGVSFFLQPQHPWKEDLPQMLAAMGEPSFWGNGDTLGTSQESKRTLPVRWSSLLAPSTWWTCQVLLFQVAMIMKSARPKAELLNYWEKIDSCMSL